jgi:hypothetical protein
MPYIPELRVSGQVVLNVGAVCTHFQLISSPAAAPTRSGWSRSLLPDASRVTVSPTCAYCREPPLMTADSPALTTVALTTEELDTPPAVVLTDRVTSYSVPTTSEYAGTLKIAGF